jgi:hypothetical protein
MNAPNNHSFAAPLKTAIDWYSTEWPTRPVAFVSYGDNQLLPVLAAHREEAGSFRKVEVCHEQPLLAIRMVAKQRSIWPYNCRGGRRTLACLVDRGEVAGVLGGAAQCCLFVE